MVMPNARHRYGNDHKKRRTQWTPRVNAGTVTCWRCGHLIQPGTPWDLGHADGSTTIYNGPEHRRCNRGAAAKLMHSRNDRDNLHNSETW
jgi:hypothetical protein